MRELNEFELMTFKQVVKLLKVAPKTLQGWVDKDLVIGAQRVGNTIVFDRDFRLDRSVVSANVSEIAARMRADTGVGIGVGAGAGADTDDR